jgi:hypothetical protein
MEWSSRWSPWSWDQGGVRGEWLCYVDLLWRETECLSMMSRKMPSGGGCLEEPILERASASSFFFHSTHSTE